MICATLSRSFAASAAGIAIDLESRRRGSPICTLAHALIEAGHDPADNLHVYRAGVLCFRPAPLGMWAWLRVREGDDESARFVSHREPPAEMVDSARRWGHLPAISGLPGVTCPRRPSRLSAARGARHERRRHPEEQPRGTARQRRGVQGRPAGQPARLDPGRRREMRPGKQGLALRVDRLPELRQALEQAVAEAERQGLMSERAA